MILFRLTRIIITLFVFNASDKNHIHFYRIWLRENLFRKDYINFAAYDSISQHVIMNQDLQKFFTLALSVDCVVFGFDDEGIKLLLIERNADPYNGYWALPGDLVHPEKDLKDSVNEVLFNLTGISNLYFEQVETFGEVNRHPFGRVITASYYTLVKISDYKLNPSSFAREARWILLSEVGQLAFDHNKIVNACFNRLKSSVRIKPIGFELLPEMFTLSELQSLYESILGESLDTRNFRKKLAKMSILKDMKKTQKSVSHRPAKLFSFDVNRYNALVEVGFNFEI
jgi:8-oxo-dGTP diphosphatase